ncbi:hypothetical protein CLV24_11176 [Pontibacter ummariensis]|uniref:Uncharacterized protein n=1 Tax=Pontibacter ummariensis TaxID=1610492 RepID=A0A239GJ25_9BACT|nr:hypothetical protein [Pontibacter ummariensis]PRY11281.1 hypothetical protein CLV24_11176 [Pontibacter ummariensis]SNS68802.1 hypothetical protein SAMN06296052_11176 [Pontibacter ummariensis]
MNRNQSDRYGNNSGFQTHRSERYRHPENDNMNRFDDYGASRQGTYRNEGNSGNWGSRGNDMGGSRNTSNQDIYGTYSTSRNYGSMGSYGGAQGFGSSRGGYASQRRYDSDTNFNADSGRGSYNQRNQSNYSPAGHRAYGYQSDYDSHGSNMGSNSGNDLYGSSTSRRFQGSDQGRYNFDRDNRNSGSGYRDMYGTDRNSRDSYNSPNYGGSEGNYMGSGYNRTTGGNYGSDEGNSRSSDFYNRMNMNRGTGEYGRSDYYRGPYGDRDINTGNNLFRHPESDYDYNPNRSFTRDNDRARNRSYDRNSDRY